MENLKQLFASKKFWIMVGGLVATILVTAVPSLEQYQEQLPEFVWLLVSFIIGQGLADFGKHSNE